jgi:hypothetical protein
VRIDDRIHPRGRCFLTDSVVTHDRATGGSSVETREVGFGAHFVKCLDEPTWDPENPRLFGLPDRPLVFVQYLLKSIYRVDKLPIFCNSFGHKG